MTETFQDKCFRIQEERVMEIANELNYSEEETIREVLRYRKNKNQMKSFPPKSNTPT